MDTSTGLAITVATVLTLGATGAFLGHRFPVPAGILFGTLVGVGGGGVLLNALFGLPQPPVPSWLNGALQVMLGMLVGLRMTREELRAGVRALVPASLVTAVLIFVSVGTALAATRLTSVDEATAIFAAAPGGLTEMSVVSIGFGADGTVVAAVQLVRVLLAMAVLSVLLRRFEPKDDPDREEGRNDGSADMTGYAEDLKGLLAAALWGVAGGLAGILSHLPAAGIIGALVGSAAFRLVSKRPVPIRRFQLGVQAAGGGVIGLGVSTDILGVLVHHAEAGALIVSVQMLLWLAMGWLLVRLFRYDLSTSALASTPGGLSGVIAATTEAGADTVVVTFIQLVRLTTIVTVVPVLVALFFGR